MTRIEENRWLAICLSLLGGLTIGLSGFSSDSNHPTYLPPALHALDSSYLAGDWWLTKARHYHFVFFAIVAFLERLGILETGLAVLNILTVAGTLYLCFLIIGEITRSNRMKILAIFVAVFLMTRTFYSLGSSYLFTPSLQASSLAAAATIGAMLALLRRRFWTCGAWLAAAGLCHVNFLVVNIPFFATAYLLLAWQERRSWKGPGDFAVGLATLLGPSVVLLGLFAPLLLGVGTETLSPSEAAFSDWIFFRFAVPFHYFPRSYLSQLYPFFCWQVVGLLWTGYAVADPAQRRVAWALQLALAAVIWTATALTTIIFLPAVSRLFLWRLAPFAVLLSAMMAITGTVRAAERSRADVTRRDWFTVAVSFVLLPVLLIPAVPLAGQMVATDGLWPAGAVLGGLFLLVALRWSLGADARPDRRLTVAVLIALLLISVATQPSDGLRSRYSLIIRSPAMEDQRALFAFIRRSTPRDAVFLIPPELAYFRLEAGRATVADLKALPINRSGLIEWYERLADVSGLAHPATPMDVVAGFRTLDPARIDFLSRKYGITYIVTRADQAVQAEGWEELFRNRGYRLLARSSPQRAAPTPPLTMSVDQQGLTPRTER